MLFQTGNLFDSERRQAFLRQMFRRVFLEDWGTKLVALGITIALWLGVTGLRAPSSKRFNNVSLNLSYSNEMEITNSPINEVDVVITGDKAKIERLRREDLIVSFDLTDVKAGERVIQLAPDTVTIELPSGLKVEEIQPNKIAVKLEPVEEREVEVTPDLEGNVAEGFEVYAKIINPPRVRVRGPQSFIKSLDSISTERISLENRREDFTARQVELLTINPKIRLLDTIVDITFKIGEERTERRLTIPYKTEADTKPHVATAVLYGARSIIENLRAEDLRVEFSTGSTGETVPQLVIPQEIQDKIEVKNLTLK